MEQHKSDELQNELYSAWEGQMTEAIFYMDGHVRVYWGTKAKLSKKYVSRQKLCLPGTTQYSVNTQEGQPLLCIIGELTDGLKQDIESFIAYKISNTSAQYLQSLKQSKDKVWFTIVFDREAYEPKWFKKLWDDHRIAVITYRKSVKDRWDENQFSPYEITISDNKKTMLLCELGSLV